MCELFGVSCKQCIEINEYLKKFYKNCEEHPHGWGLAIMQDNQSIIDKQPVKASESEYLKNLLAKPIYVEHAFAHIRLATAGCMQSFNCHPFMKIDNHGRTWTLVHNGTIFEYDPLNKYRLFQAGVTDSERILLYLIDQINEVEDKRDEILSDEECFQIIEDIISKLSKNNKLNLMIYNGSMMFVHTNCKNGINYLKTDSTIYLSTRKLTEENWKEVPINTLFGIKDGKLIHRGKPHQNEYEITEENIKFILKNVGPNIRESIIKNFGVANAEELITNY